MARLARQSALSLLSLAIWPLPNLAQIEATGLASGSNAAQEKHAQAQAPTQRQQHQDQSDSRREQEELLDPNRVEQHQFKQDEKPKPQQEQPTAPSFQSLFSIPIQGKDYKPTKAIRCDTVRHLKTPITYRNLDTYMRPEVILPAGKESDPLKRDFATGDWGGFRSELYKSGVDIYGCLGFDNLNVLQGNLSNDPNVKTPAPNYQNQQNYIQLYGLDFLSELFNKNWKGGQLHFSFAWPQSRPIWLYGNNLTPGMAQAAYSNFYYDTGAARANLDQYQGFRVFEIWYQQIYDKKGSFWRVGNIYPWINMNRSILAALFNFTAFDSPSSLGTTPTTGAGPVYPVAPLGVQWYWNTSHNWEVRAQVGAGYYDPTGGLGNRRGLSWFLNNNMGIEGVAEVTYKRGTYSGNPNDFGLPWFIRLGGQFHTGSLYSNYLDSNGNSFQASNLPPMEYNFNSGLYLTLESMLFREKGSYNQGLTAFFKTTQYFQDYANQVRDAYAIGLGYEGLIPGRDRDVLLVGWSLTNLTRGSQLWEAASGSCINKIGGGCQPGASQIVVEVDYSANLTPWMFIQPGIQFLSQPYGRLDLGSIVNFTLSLGISF